MSLIVRFISFKIDNFKFEHHGKTALLILGERHENISTLQFFIYAFTFAQFL